MRNWFLVRLEAIAWLREGGFRSRLDSPPSPALVAQWIEQRFPKPCVAGSIPAGGTTSTSGNGLPGNRASPLGARARSLLSRTVLLGTLRSVRGSAPRDARA